MNNIISKIIYVVVYIILLVTIIYFFGDYTKQLLILQFTNNKVVLGKITNIEYKLENPPPFSYYTIDYTFSYNGKKYDASFTKFAIYYYFYLPDYRYEPGYSVKVLYNTDNNFFFIRQELPLEIVKSIILWIILPLFPIFIFDCIKLRIIRKRIEKKYDPQAEPGRYMVRVLLGCAILCAMFLLVKLYVVIRDADKTNDTLTGNNSPIKIHNTAAADIVNTISKYTFENPLIVFNDYPYYCRIYVEDNYLYVDGTEDGVNGHVIFAYKIDSEMITLILKHFAFGYNEKTGNYYQKIKYFNVELKNVKGEIIAQRHEINAIRLNGFTINGAYITGKSVNITLEPLLKSGIYDTLSVDSEDVNYIKVIAIENKRVQINDMHDFWYQIEYENKKLWVYGYYVCFWNCINLEQKP